MIDGNQCTVIWHVDDLKISHVDPKVVTWFLNKFQGRYGNIMPVTVTRGKVHNYLGMIIGYRTAGQVKFNMYQYVDDVLENVPSVYKKGIGFATPAPDNLYEVRQEGDEDLILLSKEETEEYHTTTAKLLYLSKRARSDILTSIAFHCTRVRKPDIDDQKKLSRTIRHLEYTKHLPMILS